MSIAKIATVTAMACLLAAPSAFAQSAGTSLGGTSNGQQGTPPASGANGTTGASQTGTAGATSAGKAGDTPGNSGALGQGTAAQHEKFGN